MELIKSSKFKTESYNLKKFSIFMTTETKTSCNLISKILIGLAGLILGFLIAIYLQPNDYRISRSIVIAKPAAEIFPHINNLKNWEAWSPWLEFDPKATNSYSGPEGGVGAVSSWDGEKIGQGSMTVINIEQDQLVKFKLDFVKPMKDTSNAEFVLKQVEDGTKVTWAMYGKHDSFLRKLSWPVMCSRMVGMQFDKGLKKLKSIVEAAH